MSISRAVPPWWSFFLFPALLLCVDRCFCAFASQHFIPARKLETALGVRAADVVVTGDSRMAAAFVSQSFGAGWRAGTGFAPRVADMSLGGVGLAGQVVAVRRFFERGGTARLVLLGTVPEALKYEPADPDNWIGNEAITIWWSHATDAKVHFNEESSNPRTFDARFRFTMYRVSTLASLRSLLWFRAQRLQDSLLQKDRMPSNAFGEVDEMRALEARWVAQGLEASRAGVAAWTLSPWVCELRRVVDDHRARLIVAELPMPSSYRPVRESGLGRELRTRLPTDFCGRNVPWVDLSTLPGLTDADFSDGLHVGHGGAELVSQLLGLRTAVLSPPRE